MARSKKLTNPTDVEIVEIHRRYVEVMEEIRLETIDPETKQSYLLVLRSLTEKLAMPSKPLNEILRELMTEAGPIIFQIMQSNR
jgi:hypothetical protein